MIRHSIQANLPLECGTVLKDAPLVFHTSAPSWDGIRKVIWICHALTANSDPQDWWPEMVGPGKPIDTDRHFVVCVNFPGSSYGSVSAASINPESGKPWLLDFPALTIRDMASVFPIVQKHLGIDRIDLLIGSSIGG
ncbi:MAG: alpha/beta fold hydrolase, partial [Bacteroidales bacterium]|nr:alpha/beta fold hydrolase [Bacteroidales bacterium]